MPFRSPILDRVVAVDVQVALGLDSQVDRAVAGNLVEHMVEETDAGSQLRLAAAVEVDDHSDLRFSGIADDFGNAAH
jgi:hypothetical protein